MSDPVYHKRMAKIDGTCSNQISFTSRENAFTNTSALFLISLYTEKHFFKLQIRKQAR